MLNDSEILIHLFLMDARFRAEYFTPAIASNLNEGKNANHLNFWYIVNFRSNTNILLWSFHEWTILRYFLKCILSPKSRATVMQWWFFMSVHFGFSIQIFLHLTLLISPMDFYRNIYWFLSIFVSGSTKCPNAMRSAL